MTRRSSSTRMAFGLSLAACARTLAALLLLLGAWPAGASAQTGGFTGTVTVAGTGTPLMNAYVYVYDSSGSLLGYAATNASGVYTKSGLAPGTYYARSASGAGYLDKLYNDLPCYYGNCTVTSGTPITVVANVTTPGINFSLALGGSVTGTVTAAGTGLPLAGVVLNVYDSTGAYRRNAVTNTSGVYTVFGLATDRFYVHTASGALGYVDEAYDDTICVADQCNHWVGTPVSVTAGSTTPGINFTLAQAGSISGTITADGTGLPLANVYVSAYSNFVTSNTATTDASGVYTITGLPAGDYRVLANSYGDYVDELYNNLPYAGGSYSYASGTTVPVLAGAPTNGINFGLALGGTITGTVTAADTGLPLSGALVYVATASGGVASGAVTNASGVFTVTGVATGTYKAYTSNSVGYVDRLYADVPCPGGCSAAKMAGTNIYVTALATTSEIDFALSPGGSITGTVTVAGTSTPIPGIVVEIYDSAGRSMGTTSTKTDGVYTKTGLPTGTYYVRTMYGNSAEWVHELYDDIPCPATTCTVTSGAGVSVAAPAATSGIDFGLKAGGTISGTVTDGVTGAPLAGVTVAVYTASEIPIGNAQTNAAGVYVRSGLATGSYRVRTVYALGYVDEAYPNTPCPYNSCAKDVGSIVNVTVGMPTGGIDFQLAKAGAVSGTITLAATGAALADISVYVVDSSGAMVGNGKTSNAGFYTTSATVPAGTYYVRTEGAYRSGYVDTLYGGVPCPGGACTITSGSEVGITASATTSGINIALTAGGAIAGAVTAAGTGTPLFNFRVNVYDSVGNPVGLGATTDSWGVYVMRGLPAGTYYLRTSNTLGFLDELYGGRPCAQGLCTVTSGTAVTVTGTATTDGVNFELAQLRVGAADFTGDLMRDILWRHGTQGDVWLWPMDGAATTSETYVRTVSDTTWEIRGQGDMTGDGKADLLWRNSVTGQVYFWPMNGPAPQDEIYVGTVDPAYDIVGTGDFDGDGRSDILWRNAAVGDVWVWLMDGATRVAETYVDTVDPGYVVKGVGDVDGDLRADLVWRGAAGDVWVWLMNGTARLSQTYVGTVADTHYQIQQVADFDGNGTADLLWWNDVQGDVWVWPMDGTTVLAETYVGTVTDTQYRIQAAGDYNGDGKADILWRHTLQGDVWVWLMDGPVKLSETWVGTVPDLDYQIIR